jgi:uncharacterized protein (DUF58 family)
VNTRVVATVLPGRARDAPGVYAELADLVALEHRVRGFTLLPHQPVHSLLTGRRSSRLRGRGMTFEEIRVYLPGDDVRTIDWKVTARTGEPHVRVYTEERDRPGLLVVDQRLSMFFGTRRAMKSVTAAEVAALALWRLFTQGDRVGAVVFDDRDVVDIAPHRSRGRVLGILHAILEKNHALRADAEWPPGPGGLNTALERAGRLATHDHVVGVISDFDGLDDATERLVTGLAEHNDVIAFPIYDPAQTFVPEGGRLVVGDGELQLELDLGRETVRRGLREFGDRRLARLDRWQAERAVAVLPLSTAEDPALQMQRLLGGLARPRRRRP